MPQKTPQTLKQPGSAEHDLGCAKQEDLLVMKQNSSALGIDVSQFIDENERQHRQMNNSIDFLAIKAIENNEAHERMNRRLDRIETVVEKTYKLLDTHVKAQIRFDHELAATRNIVDGHGKRISALEAKG